MVDCQDCKWNVIWVKLPNCIFKGLIDAFATFFNPVVRSTYQSQSSSLPFISICHLNDVIVFLKFTIWDPDIVMFFQPGFCDHTCIYLIFYNIVCYQSVYIFYWLSIVCHEFALFFQVSVTRCDLLWYCDQVAQVCWPSVIIFWLGLSSFPSLI